MGAGLLLYVYGNNNILYILLGVIAREARRISTIAAQSKVPDLIENSPIL